MKLCKWLPSERWQNEEKEIQPTEMIHQTKLYYANNECRMLTMEKKRIHRGNESKSGRVRETNYENFSPFKINGNDCRIDDTLCVFLISFLAWFLFSPLFHGPRNLSEINFILHEMFRSIIIPRSKRSRICQRWEFWNGENTQQIWHWYQQHHWQQSLFFRSVFSMSLF